MPQLAPARRKLTRSDVYQGPVVPKGPLFTPSTAQEPMRHRVNLAKVNKPLKRFRYKSRQKNGELKEHEQRGPIIAPEPRSLLSVQVYSRWYDLKCGPK